ncbi:hypothetical protein ONZ45_g10 [Pleurotus djamor]|nr:hypothetical protein ONZ45_g10 [Pleurotus djamor]
MSDDEDYLSDKFLLEVASAGPSTKTYSSLRKDAQRRSQLQNEQGKTKSRRQREQESREEGLQRSLFARAEDDAKAGLSSGNKALSIMMKMGFKPGQSLGQTDAPTSPIADAKDPSPGPPTEQDMVSLPEPRHKAEPLQIKEWAGKKGIGSLKRPPSPASRERVAKMAKMAAESHQVEFRDRARQQFVEKQAEARLRPAQRTCNTLDEQEGISFNILWLNPSDPETFPSGLIDALELHTSLDLRELHRTDHSIEGRLRQQMRADALGPSEEIENGAIDQSFPEDTLEEAAQFLRLQACDRLELVLSYLRKQYLYCFWCGTRFADEAEMDETCPGVDEESHD